MLIQQSSGKPEVDLGVVTGRVTGWINGALSLLPNIVVAVIVIIVFYALGRLAGRLVRQSLHHGSRDNLGEVLGGFAKWVVLIAGILLAATIVLPSLSPGDLVGGLGISSVAIGFAFKDILQNWLAGLLILLRQPFQVGDQIEVTGHEGTVERIETRATIIKTYDGQRIVIPNSDIYTNAVLVKTAHETRRSLYDVGIGYGDDIRNACSVILEALGGIADVEKEPAPEALPWDLAASWVTIRVRWWTRSRRADVVLVHAEVITAIKYAFDEAGIDMPYETQVQLLHNQSEATDGIRGARREGWPAPREGSTLPQWEAEKSGRS